MRIRIPYWVRNVKYFIQRGRRGWADCDTWSFDDYLCKVIIGGLGKLEKDNYGCPSEFWDSSKINDECHKWKECLREIKIAFEMIREDSFSYTKKWVDGEKTFDLIVIKQREDKINKGLELFSRYFRCLWS